MAGELHDNAEAKAFTPAGVESPRLQQTNQDMLDARHLFTSGKSAASEPTSLDFGNPGSLYGNENVIAQNYQDVRQAGLRTDVVRMMAPGTVERGLFPYRGFEDQRLADCTKDNPQAWNQAFESYPKLQQYLSEQYGTQLMKALVRNELHWYDAKDKAGDQAAQAGKPNQTETLGYEQITPKGVQEFESGVINGQKVREPDTNLTKFLASKGYSGPGHEAKALEDPSCAPMIVAAKLNTLVQAYEKSGTAVNARTLAYGYNADVYYNPSHPSGFHAAAYPGASAVESRLGNVKAFPTDSEAALKESIHLRNVEAQMKQVH
jgi:hypothetical protein